MQSAFLSCWEPRLFRSGAQQLSCWEPRLFQSGAQQLLHAAAPAREENPGPVGASEGTGSRAQAADRGVSGDRTGRVLPQRLEASSTERGTHSGDSVTTRGRPGLSPRLGSSCPSAGPSSTPQAVPFTPSPPGPEPKPRSRLGSKAAGSDPSCFQTLPDFRSSGPQSGADAPPPGPLGPAPVSRHLLGSAQSRKQPPTPRPPVALPFSLRSLFPPGTGRVFCDSHCSVSSLLSFSSPAPIGPAGPVRCRPSKAFS